MVANVFVAIVTPWFDYIINMISIFSLIFSLIFFAAMSPAPTALHFNIYVNPGKHGETQ